MENQDHKSPELSGYKVNGSGQLKGQQADDQQEKPAKRFSVREIIFQLSLSLAAKGNRWLSTFSSGQQRSLVVALLFLLACYFVILSGRSFFAGSSDNQSPFPSLQAPAAQVPAAVPPPSPGNNPPVAPSAIHPSAINPEVISPEDSLLFETADTANSLTP